MLNKAFKLSDMPRKGPEDEGTKKSPDEERYKRHQRLLDGEIDKEVKRVEQNVGELRRIAGETEQAERKDGIDVPTDTTHPEREAK